MSKLIAPPLAAAILATLSFYAMAQEGETTAPAEAASMPAAGAAPTMGTPPIMAAPPMAAPGAEGGYGQMPPMRAAPMMDPGYGQMMPRSYGQMMDPGYSEMPEPAYGQGMMPGYGQPMTPEYGQMPYGSPYEQMPYGYGAQQMMPGMLSQQGMPQGGQYPAIANPYKEMQPPMGQGMAPGMHSGYRAARMAEREDFHRVMLEKLDAIAERLDRIENALQERGE